MQPAPDAIEKTAENDLSAVFFVFAAGFMLELVFQSLLAHCILTDAMVQALLYALLYAIVFCVSRSFLAQRLAVIYLILPLVIFALGWLRWYYAVPFLAIVLYALRSLLTESTDPNIVPACFADQLTAFLILVCWLHLSGSGGHGFQSVDYLMHNGRLHDLINYHWPVKYESVNASWPFPYEGQNMLVFYLSYYLPAALVGKWAGYDFALTALYFWTLLGLTIVLFLLQSLTRVRYLSLLVLAMILFAGWDIVGLLLACVKRPDLLNLDIGHWFESIDFWGMLITGESHLRGYPANTFQLYFAPHQAVAGWMIACLQLKLFVRGNYKVLGLITAWYAFWAPMMLLMMIPFIICLLMLMCPTKMRELFSFENVAGGGLIIMLFACFYVSGAAANVSHAWLWQDVDKYWLMPIIIPGITYGSYLFFILFYRRYLVSETDKKLGVAMVISLWMALLYRVGNYNDFMMRGVLPLSLICMYLMLVLIRNLLENNKVRSALFGIGLMLPGVFSAAHLMGKSLTHYNSLRPAVSVSQYYENYEQLGREDSFFFHYLARHRDE